MSKAKKHKQAPETSAAPPSLFDDLELLNEPTAAPPTVKDETQPQGGANLSAADRKTAAVSHGGNGPLHELMDSNFLQFASYTICNRAIPTVEDGLKPVQRRIMHSLWEKDDGRFIKVANIVGHTMQYHPHGDASIGDAIVNLTNKRYLIEGQGNYGNIHTGDPAAATRYIECRLTELARSELFNPKLTTFIPSYDGRNKEPSMLPSKLPLLLMLGAEGIAVGLSTSIFPHNFIELLEAQIEIIRNRPFKVLPDFQTGGLMDVSEYDDGTGRVKLRAVIEHRQQNKLVITALPWGQTTESLISNIEDAIKKKKVPVKQIHDFTAEKVEIELTLNTGVSQEQAIKALYAFTACEYALTSRPVVLYRNRPHEMPVSEILKSCTEQLLELLRRELEIRQKELDDLFHAKTMEQIFIEKRIYKLIEEQTTYENVRQAVTDGFKPYLKQLRRDITADDVEHLLQIRIRRISRYDINRNREEINNILAEEEEVSKNLQTLRAYAIRYLKALVKKYAKVYPRMTKIAQAPFGQIEVRALTATELTLKIDRENGYIGTDIRNGEDLFKCSSMDKIMVVWNDGHYKMMPPPDKFFVDKNHLYCSVFDRDKLFTAVYTEPDYGFTYIKRFAFGGAIQNKDYRMAPEKSKILIFEEGTPDSVFVKYKPAKSQRIHQQMFTPSEVLVKNVSARGIQMTSKDIARVSSKKPGWWNDADTSVKGVLN
ncbi:MAG: DNA topoisomerase IV subunit A [Kiritimatiellae bacterium]|nr:DNA topoisomerase IV subunit A [Kiritimatiellia bacterium]